MILLAYYIGFNGCCFSLFSGVDSKSTGFTYVETVYLLLLGVPVFGFWAGCLSSLSSSCPYFHFEVFLPLPRADSGRGFEVYHGVNSLNYLDTERTINICLKEDFLVPLGQEKLPGGSSPPFLFLLVQEAL